MIAHPSMDQEMPTRPRACGARARSDPPSDPPGNARAGRRRSAQAREAGLRAVSVRCRSGRRAGEQRDGAGEVPSTVALSAPIETAGARASSPRAPPQSRTNLSPVCGRALSGMRRPPAAASGRCQIEGFESTTAQGRAPKRAGTADAAAKRSANS